MAKQNKLTFPKVQRVILERFSLFTLSPNIDIKISDGVFCLAGANGLGKSTFLAALNFGITGIVPDPSRAFKSVDEYYKAGTGYSNKFFTGRISEVDRESTSITVYLQVGDFLFQLTRTVFEPDELRALKILHASTGEVIFDGDKLDGLQRRQEYQKRITEKIGLESFEQFAFLQHLLFTFDESRHLVLWDQRVLNQALYLSIGADYEKALLADKLRREMERAGSLGRNYSWQASEIHSKIQFLLDATKGSEPDVDLGEIESQHVAIVEELEWQQNDVERKKDQLSDVELKWMELSSELNSLQTEYAKEFSRHVKQLSSVEMHPLVVATTSEAKCALCGTTGEVIVEAIKKKIDENKCPLCGSAISGKPDSADSIAKLQEIDRRIGEIKKRLNATIKAKERISAEVQVAEEHLRIKESELKDFENANEKLLIQLSGSKSGIDTTLQKKREEMREYLRLKKKKYAERDEKKKELLRLQRELQKSYLAAEEEFVPLFRHLASLFIGIDLDIRMDYSSSLASPGLSLTLEMRGTVRREDYQLSESQRFFLDIALRMALAQYMAGSKGGSCLFIDTPEGSLDIAYESRAGQMFANFANSGNNIIMTANINTSQILQKLAQKCGHSKMRLHRMTSWAELSDVQMAEEDLFEKAYSQIESELESGKTQ